MPGTRQQNPGKESPGWCHQNVPFSTWSIPVTHPTLVPRCPPQLAPHINISQNFLRTHLTHRPHRPGHITAKSWHRITWLASPEFTLFNMARPCYSFGSMLSTLTSTSFILTSHKIQKLSENTSDTQVTWAGVHGSKILAKNHLAGVTRWEAAAQRVKWDARNTTFSRWYLNPPPSPGATSLSPTKARNLFNQHAGC